MDVEPTSAVLPATPAKRPQTAPVMYYLVEPIAYQNLTQVTSVEGAFDAGCTKLTVADPIRSTNVADVAEVVIIVAPVPPYAIGAVCK